tara:strand:+ start:2924 stop:3187 length:264 start_codon:yes stop_codon:yes gene_type:complete
MSGVGTELLKMIPKWAVREGSGCKCKSTAAKWDKYGIAWCERNRERIIDHLMSQSQYLVTVAAVVPKTIQRITVVGMVDKAIKTAKN